MVLSLGLYVYISLLFVAQHTLPCFPSDLSVAVALNGMFHMASQMLKLWLSIGDSLRFQFMELCATRKLLSSGPLSSPSVTTFIKGLSVAGSGSEDRKRLHFLHCQLQHTVQGKGIRYQKFNLVYQTDKWLTRSQLFVGTEQFSCNPVEEGLLI